MLFPVCCNQFEGDVVFENNTHVNVRKPLTARTMQRPLSLYIVQQCRALKRGNPVMLGTNAYRVPVICFGQWTIENTRPMRYTFYRPIRYPYMCTCMCFRLRCRISIHASIGIHEVSGAFYVEVPLLGSLRPLPKTDLERNKNCYQMKNPMAY